MESRTFMLTTSTIFAIIAFLHLLRVLLGLDLTIGDTLIPVWVSIIAVLVLGFLSYTGFNSKI